MKCKFETKYEKYLTEHIKNKHGSFMCEECTKTFETQSNMKMYLIKEHRKGCQICNFEGKNNEELEQHVNALHNKMFACKECTFKATCSDIL